MTSSSKPAWLYAALAALGTPLLIPISTIPDTVFFNQLAAFAGWGLWLVVATQSAKTETTRRRTPLLAALGAVALLWFAAISNGSALSAIVLFAATCVAWAGWAGSSNHMRPIAIAWWLVGLCCVAVATVQYFDSDLANGVVVAVNTSPGRAVGNMRQPNHLATALLCSMVMVAWLCAAGQLRLRWMTVSIAAMVFGVVLSASRGGAWSLGVLLIWAVLDRGLQPRIRWTLALTPVWYVFCWLAVTAYSKVASANFYGLERLQAHGDISSSRIAIWRNTLALIAQNPWTGVGWGNFNFAWTFSKLPDRPVAFFDHSHNMLLELAVELGLPATVAIVGLLLSALWMARGALRMESSMTHAGRALLALLVVLCIHSQLEYPLWYAYFLLPAAWAIGRFLGSTPSSNAVAKPTFPVISASNQTAANAWALRMAGLLMVWGSVYAVWDHHRIEVIFAPSAGAGSLESRIAEGQHSLLFGHHADYAAVTTDPKDTRLATFRRPLHQLIDVRLLEAYIEALKANGHDAQALYAAQRLREFRRDDAQEYFNDCTPDNPAPPFQCDTRPVPLTWRDMEPPR